MNANELDETYDKMGNETGPGVQTRRYRLIGMGKDEHGGHVAALELVPEPGNERCFRTRVVESMFLPHTWREQIAYQEPDAITTQAPIEFEITVRRAEPTAGFTPESWPVEVLA